MGLIVAIGVSAQGRCKGFVYDTDGYVNVRKGMSSSSDIVRQMDNNQTLYYSTTGTNWYQVSLTPSGKAIGYVYWNRISVSGEDLLRYVVTDADGYTNVRKGASTKTAIVKTMNSVQKISHFRAVLYRDFFMFIPPVKAKEFRLL